MAKLFRRGISVLLSSSLIAPMVQLTKFSPRLGENDSKIISTWNPGDIPFCHHEKWDGSGYPKGLMGEQIPMAARIFAMIDVYDALTSDRPYRKAWTKEEAMKYIREQSGRHFDPKVVEHFVTLIEERHGDL